MFNRHKKRVKSVNLTDFYSEELKNNAEKVLKQRISSLKAESGKENSSELSESEIMKALECCAAYNYDNCAECPMNECSDCDRRLPNLALELLNRKNAENAEKDAELERRTKDRYLCHQDGKIELLPRTDLDKIRAEAIKFFVGRLKAHSRKMQSSDWSGEFWDIAVLVTDIDKTAKEMGVEL